MKPNLKEARMDIRLKEGEPLDVDKLRKAVIDAGFTPTWVRFQASGTLVMRNGAPGLNVTETGQVIPLADDDTYKALEEKAGSDGRRISIVGEIAKGEHAARIENFHVR